MISAILHSIVLFAYLAAAVLYGANLALKEPKRLLQARYVYLTGFALHTLAIGHFCVTYHQSPFSSAFGSLSVSAWAMVLLFIPIDYWYKLPALGSILMPLSSAFIFGAILRSDEAIRQNPEIQEHFINLHIMLVLFSFALFALAACCAICYLWQYRFLKRPNRKAMFLRLPPLEKLDSMALHLIAFALPLLTLGLAFGIIKALSGGLKGDWIWDPHTIISFLVWLLYGSYLLLRNFTGFRGPKSHFLLVVGFFVSLILFIIPSGSHHFR